MKRTIKNPHWTNNARSVLSVEFHYDDGRILTAVINKDDVGNPDWEEVKREFTDEQLEANTQQAIRKQAITREKEKQQREAMEEKKRQEELFAIKLKAFEVDIVKNTTNRQLKSAIRRAKSDFEVYAYTTALILEEYNTKNTQQPESE